MTAGTNDALFIDVLAQIEAHPETWNQEQWNNECGTSFCMAGWACELSGVRHLQYGMVDKGFWTWEAAATLLGVTERVYNDFPLFLGDSTLDDLYRISADLMGIAEQVLRDKVQDRLAS